MEVEARAMKDLHAYLTPKQIKAMIKSCDNLRDRLLIQILWRTGMRISELVKPPVGPVKRYVGKSGEPGNGSKPKKGTRGGTFIEKPPSVLGLRVSGILWDENCFIIRHAKRKGNPPRRINVDPETMAMLRDYLEKRSVKSEWVMPITRQMAYLVVRRAAERIGIKEIGDAMVSERRHPHPHHLRHSLAVHSVKKTKGSVDGLIKLQNHLGHASFSTTASYANFSNKEQRGWYDDLWEGEEEE